MKRTTIWIGISTCGLCFLFCASMPFWHEKPRFVFESRNKSFANGTDNEVILNLNLCYSLRSPPLEPTSVFIQLVVWSDGWVLTGKEKSREKNTAAATIFNFEPYFEPYPTIINYEYYYGKVNPKRIQALLRSIETNLRLKKRRTTMIDLGPEASFYSLCVNYADASLDLKTWEQYANAKHSPQYNVLRDPNTGILHEGQEAEIGTFRLPDFYKGWKVIKKEMFDLRDEVMAAPNSKLVDIEWTEGARKLFIRDKFGKLILECIYPLSLSRGCSPP